VDLRRSTETAVAKAGAQRSWLPAALLWLAGNGLRLTILAVPPVVALIRDEFGLNATQVGLLSSIPPALFALAALGGSLLVARLGVKGALAGGLLLVAAGSAWRGFSGSYLVLLAATVLMSAGVAIMQPIMPSAVREWLPARVGLGTAIYTNGLLVGELLAVWLTIPFVLPAVHGEWRMALLVWSVPIGLIAAAILFLAPTSRGPRGAARVPDKWLPDWHQGLVWRLGTMFCCINAIYFSTNAFIPIYLKSAGRDDLIGSALTALNLGQIPASLLLLAIADRLERRAWPYVLSGLLSFAGVAGLVFIIGPWTPLWAGLLGFSDAGALIVGLTLPALLCRAEDVARTAAGTFTISYGGAVLLAILSGAAWDLSGIPALAFAPMALCAAVLAAVAAVMRARSDLR
jgi:MFS transporter, CP family, cyanate transporter